MKSAISSKDHIEARYIERFKRNRLWMAAVEIQTNMRTVEIVLCIDPSSTNQQIEKLAKEIFFVEGVGNARKVRMK